MVCSMATPRFARLSFRWYINPVSLCPDALGITDHAKADRNTSGLDGY
jgi:hypothetical protein